VPGDDCDNNIIIGTADARLVVVNSALQTLWAARAVHGDIGQPISVSPCDVAVCAILYF